jgi:ribosomal protein S4
VALEGLAAGAEVAALPVLSQALRLETCAALESRLQAQVFELAQAPRQEEARRPVESVRERPS